MSDRRAASAHPARVSSHAAARHPCNHSTIAPEVACGARADDRWHVHVEKDGPCAAQNAQHGGGGVVLLSLEDSQDEQKSSDFYDESSEHHRQLNLFWQLAHAIHHLRAPDPRWNDRMPEFKLIGMPAPLVRQGVVKAVGVGGWMDESNRV